MEAGRPLVSVIIVNYNGGDVTLRSVMSILSSGYPNLEVIVVDNGSTDGSIERIESLGLSRVRVVKLGRNTGFSYANNVGARIARGYLLFFLNNDAFVEGNAISILVETYKDLTSRGVKAGTLQPKLLSVNGLYYDGAGDFVDSFGYPFTLGAGDANRGQYDCLREIFSARGAAFMIRRALFLAVGGFDEGFFMGLEDVDLGWRLRALGFKNFYVPQAVVYHIGGYSARRSRCISMIPRNMLALLAKNARRRMQRWLLPALLRYLYGVFYAALRLDTCSLRRTLGDALAGLRLLRYGLSESIGAEGLLGHLVKPRRSVFALWVATKMLWKLSYRRGYRKFGEYFNAHLMHYVELSCVEGWSFRRSEILSENNSNNLEGPML